MAALKEFDAALPGDDRAAAAAAVDAAKRHLV